MKLERFEAVWVSCRFPTQIFRVDNHTVAAILLGLIHGRICPI